MEIKEYGSLANRENFYFWHVGRREILKEAIFRSGIGVKNLDILDVGCGTGGNIILLKKFGRVVGLDSSAEALKFAERRGFAQLIQASATKLPLPDNAFDLVSILDVLEHIEDDRGVIGEALRVLRPGGLLLITVPAYQWLWSQHDKALHHIRRYTKREVTSKVRHGGFEVLEQSYFVMLAVPITLFRKLRDKLLRNPDNPPKIYDIVPPPLVNTLLLFLLRCEKILLRFMRLPFGTSIMVVAKKS